MSGEAVLAHLLALAPPGDAYPRARESNWARALAPLAREVDPRAAPRMLEDYERVLGDDPCLGPSSALPLGIRQQLAHQRWTNRGGATPAYFIALAAAVGVVVTVTESTPFETGVAEAGAEMVLEEGRFEWVVNLPATVLLEFETGVAETGSPMGDFVPSPVECLIRAAAPAHTTVYFNYAGG